MGQPIDTASVLIVPDVAQFQAAIERAITSAMRDVQSTVASAMARVERSFGEAATELGIDFQRGGEVAEQALREVATTGTVAMARVATSSDAAASAISGRLTTA